MNELPGLVYDLALILVVAGFVTILFKRFRQPLVLGYIVAGFLTGPHMPYSLNISNMESIDIWAEIGIIFIMFSLGLEFSFRKILKMGISPIITALTILFSMFSLGNLIGQVFSWSYLDCMFLGGMLAMSSTTIIYKAFDDAGIFHQSFAKGVLSVLILEDIFGILLMVLLSTLAVSNSFDSSIMIDSSLKLLFFIVLWFLIGVFLIPLFLRKFKSSLNSESLLIVSVGLCFAMVAIVSKLDYSAALGAFMMGSIFAETVEAEQIEHLISPVKDLFGAVFFVSVGMMVDPSILIDYALPISVITLVIIFGQAIFGTTGFLLAGKSFRVAIQSGFSMAQIGEFAFIIASLGLSLKVISPFLYPVVVAVSVITTFLTPYMIKLSIPFYNMIAPYLPAFFDTKDLNSKKKKKKKKMSNWSILSVEMLYQVAIYSVLSIAVIVIFIGTVYPLYYRIVSSVIGNYIFCLITLSLTSVFLRPIIMIKNHSKEFIILWKSGLIYKNILRLSIILRIILVMAVAVYIINYFCHFNLLISLGIAFLYTILIIISPQVKSISIYIKKIFMNNMSSRERLAVQKGKIKAIYANYLHTRDLHIFIIEMPERSKFFGMKLMDLNWGREYGIMIASVLRSNCSINIPDGEFIIFPHDRLQVIGSDENIQIFIKMLNSEIVQGDICASNMQLAYLIIDENSSFANKLVKDTGLKNQYNAMLVGFEEGKAQLTFPSAKRMLKVGDIVWLVAEKTDLLRIPGLVLGKE